MHITLHKNARTTPAVRAEIVASCESARVLARRYGISMQTVYKWKNAPASTTCRTPCAVCKPVSHPRKRWWLAETVGINSSIQLNEIHFWPGITGIGHTETLSNKGDEE